MLDNDLSCDIAEVRAIAEALVSIDQNDSELYSRAGPFLIRILADKAGALDKKHDALEKEIIELRRNQRPS